ncbi:hypothetical protein [Herbaspirillum chlorophenolicum]|uniref:hypothetical protein n=1 Tax=Herbaspirillum chlorophenolicum TaxID=211589 RepID=UPI00067CBAD5|nr:hypothetical protein [Herbaspirillum chlorophenolicum]
MRRRSDKLYQLAVFSQFAISDGDQTGDMSQMATYLLSKTNDVRGLHALLQSTWGSKPGIRIAWNFRTSLHQLRAWEVSAALVALNISYDEATEGIAKIESKNSFGESPHRLYEKLSSVDHAKKILEEYIEKYPHKHPCQCRRAYEFIRIHDYEWIENLPGKKHKRKLTSIKEDRESILGYLKKSGGYSISGFPAYIRARIRDEKWLDSVYTRKARKPSMRVDLEQRVAIIEKAMIEMMQSPPQ